MNQLPRRDERPPVLVFMGGESAEHEVSLRSGAAVVRHLPAAGFEPVPVIVTRDGRYAFPGPDLMCPAESLDLGEAVGRIRSLDPVCAFLAMHGPFGEDGRMQALCDLMHLPHIGSDAIGSAVAMDKWLAKCVYRCAGIATPDAVFVDPDLFRADPDAVVLEVVSRLGVPVVVKTTRLGSSVGVSIVRGREELADRIRDALKYGGAFCEAFHGGRELTVPVLEDEQTGEPRALPVIEIVVKAPGRFFDYTVKYDPALVDEVCPAEVEQGLARQVQDLAVRAHRALMLSGFSRSDFLVDERGVWILETNTIPGLTEVSLFPRSARVAGVSFPDLLRTLIRRAIARAESR